MIYPQTENVFNMSEIVTETVPALLSPLSPSIALVYVIPKRYYLIIMQVLFDYKGTQYHST